LHSHGLPVMPGLFTNICEYSKLFSSVTIPTDFYFQILFSRLVHSPICNTLLYPMVCTLTHSPIISLFLTGFLLCVVIISRVPLENPKNI